MWPRSGERGRKSAAASILARGALQCGRARVSAEGPFDAQEFDAKLGLQCGRARVSAEGRRSLALTAAENSLQCGRARVSAEGRGKAAEPWATSQASMWPRSGERGRCTTSRPWSVRGGRFNVAALG